MWDRWVSRRRHKCNPGIGGPTVAARYFPDNAARCGIAVHVVQDVVPAGRERGRRGRQGTTPAYEITPGPGREPVINMGNDCVVISALPK
ncbi:hypothetical protein GWI33_007676 [Rhynchophorus ferrugineus]|uniref:Uncharacterized protein n=1 Tax=Rhynchophorus ferrugineus TaxID=354439 RepID=A0A834IHB1_RHYFE|nr:hypothetical protein GWI33_007676 [Rhynchophorus ferrugineus]